MRTFCYCVLIFTLTAGNYVVRATGAPSSPTALSLPGPLALDAHRVGNNVELRWLVSGKVKFFSVERSLDNVHWEAILNMTGSNQTYHMTEYFDVDYGVPAVKLFYRVIQVLYSGESFVSKISYVPPFDEINGFEERIIQTISDPISVGNKIKLDFVNFDHDDLLLVLRDQAGAEFYAKVIYNEREGNYLVTVVSGNIPSGQYLITATSKQQVYSSRLRIELEK